MNSSDNAQEHIKKESYRKPVLKNAGSLAELTQGFSGSIPDEQGGRLR